MLNMVVLSKSYSEDRAGNINVENDMDLHNEKKTVLETIL